MMTEASRRDAALKYLQSRHPIISMRIAGAGPLNGLGDFWSDLRDKTIGSVTGGDKAKTTALTDKLKAAVASGDTAGQKSAAGALSSLLGPSTATALYNIFRIEKGKAPVQVADVVGASKESAALRAIPIAISVALAAWAISMFTGKR